MGAAPPCTPVSPTGCRKRSPPLPCPPSSRCGSPSRSTTSADPPLSTASASKLYLPPPAHIPAARVRCTVHVLCPALYTIMWLAHCLYTNCTANIFLFPPG